MGRMTWDSATLQYHRWACRAGWEADSDYTVDRSCRLEVRATEDVVDLPCGP
jgi:hypothetical protein